jgi:pimeloyl-ACP methyl ester carboxylesterase
MDWEPLIRDRIGSVRPDLERRVIAGSTHNLHMEYPELVNAAIVEFLSGSAP